MAGDIKPPSFYKLLDDARSKSSQHVTIQSTKYPITLRTPLPSDITGLTEIMSNKENTGSDLSVSSMSTEEIEALMKKWLELKDPLEYLNFVVVLQDGEGEKAIGIAGLGYIGNAFEKGYSEDKSKQYGVAGVIMNPDVRRLGYAYEALKISIDYGIRYLDMAQVTLGTSSKNVPMRRLMEEKFKIPAEVEEEDRFGNDLVWKIGREEWLGKLQD